ncbi:hypothetical protein [Roseococcus thiosulfatophilus]|uniref:hypothetical protein n=1 Tax=Roseococcus thiosulfatophilus TaxID=35813 RepID=UPI001A8DE6FB|nr:hypothetical protein [Roseococcus thiosulfatophilus]
MPFTADDRDRLIRDPRGFMDGIACMVSQSCSTPSLRGHPDLLTFDDCRYMRAFRQESYGSDTILRDIPYLILRMAVPDDSVVFPAYLIEFEAGGAPRTVLGTGAGLAFTANMNGCTLGIGSQRGPGSACIVTHSNAVGQGSQDANTRAQRIAAAPIIGRRGRLFEPEHYRSDDKQATTFAYREGGMWRFAYISYKLTPGAVGFVVKSYGVRDVTTNSVAG